MLIVISVATSACAGYNSSALLQSNGKYISNSKELIKDYTAADLLSVEVHRDVLGHIKYTTTSVMSGSKPLMTRPANLLSDTKRDGIRLRFYADEASDILRNNTMTLAERYTKILAKERIVKWPSNPKFMFTYNIYLIQNDINTNAQITRTLHKNKLEMDFYARVTPIKNGNFHVAGNIAHETFHLMRSIIMKNKEHAFKTYSSYQKHMFDETAAYLAGQCMNINVNKYTSLVFTPINTITNSNDAQEVRKGSFNDHMLGRLIEPGFSFNSDDARTIFGPMIFTTLWAEYAGQAEVIKAGDPAADKFMDLCENHIWPPEKLIPILQEMASDGVDPPQLRSINKKKQTN